MAWETISTKADPEYEIVVDKQIRKRPNHATEVRFRLVMGEGRRVFTFNRHELYEVADVINDLLDDLEDHKF